MDDDEAMELLATGKKEIGKYRVESNFYELQNDWNVLNVSLPVGLKQVI